jgi:hypothetical protein
MFLEGASEPGSENNHKDSVRVRHLVHLALCGAVRGESGPRDVVLSNNLGDTRLATHSGAAKQSGSQFSKLLPGRTMMSPLLNHCSRLDKKLFFMSGFLTLPSHSPQIACGQNISAQTISSPLEAERYALTSDLRQPC